MGFQVARRMVASDGAVRVGWVLGTVILALAIGHLVFVAVFHLAGTDALWALSLSSDLGVGTWVAALLLGCAAVEALGCAAVHHRRRRRGFLVLAAALTLISVDEVATQHEHVGRALRERFDLDGFLYYAWFLPAAVLVLVFLAWQWRWARSLEQPLRRALGAAAALFLLGALGAEIVESKLASEGGQLSLAYQLLVAVEEVLELVATAIVILALLRHLTTAAPRWELRLRPGHVGIGPVTVPEPAEVASTQAVA